MSNMVIHVSVENSMCEFPAELIFSSSNLNQCPNGFLCNVCSEMLVDFQSQSMNKFELGEL
ncbi:hypothetical protein KC19_1G013700 [Ceratodon purpureus]|uniref:Uncharacterized protein n=1 Tax=Ceratodon purpureus TaxID=3225 RepID=A0A8T0J377_CERPU|nr:hypothetical protein KC19_1G013700 [Ceratodon purpureus]